MRYPPLLPLLLVAVLVWPSAPSAVAQPASTVELQASTNVESAVVYAQHTFPGEAERVFLARADEFADSLSSGPLQGLDNGSPLLLTPPDHLADPALAELQRLRANRVTILGGTAAVSEDVASTLREKGFAVGRIAGPTRIHTSVEVARTEFPTNSVVFLARAYAGSGEPTQAFADALAAGAAAAEQTGPVLLTETDHLSEPVRQYLAEGFVERVIVVGGEGAISPGVVTELEELGLQVSRAGGADRAATAVELAKQVFGYDDVEKTQGIILVDGSQPDAWASGFPAAALADKHAYPVLLAAGNTLPPATRDYLSTADGPGHHTLVCGTFTEVNPCGEAAQLLQIAGPAGFREVDPADVVVPAGLKLEAVARGLDFATDVTFDDQGNVYISEAGGHTYGIDPSDAPPPRILRLTEGGGTEVVYDNMVPLEVIRGADTSKLPEGLISPITGITWHNGLIYVAHRTRVSTLNPATGEFRTIIGDLPAWGEFQNNKVIFDDDGKMVFFVSTQGNSGPIGSHMMLVLDAYGQPTKHEFPCDDVVLTGKDFEVPNLFTPEPDDSELTGVYVPFGVQTEPGQVIQGNEKCNGAFYRANADGTNLELIAWGLRSDFGYRYDAQGRLISSQNSANPIPPRAILQDYETFWHVEEGKWYGWPDFYSGIPITDERFQQPDERREFVLTEETHQRLFQGQGPPQPLLKIQPHVAAEGFVFGQPSLGVPEGDVLLAEFGTVVVRLREELPGFRVEQINLETGDKRDFLVNRSGRPASATEDGAGLERPLQVEWKPDGSLYVVDFGVIEITETGLNAAPATGVIWRVSR